MTPTPDRPPAGPLAGLVAELLGEPALRTASSGLGDPVAVAEPARAAAIAALVHATTRRPLLVATPTATEAERLQADLGAYLGPEAVELFPAWETLPFERVSPALETMGRRQRVVWRLAPGAGSRELDPNGPAVPAGLDRPAVVVAPVRALVQRLGPHVDDVEPIVLRPGSRVDRDELVERLVHVGYRREYQVEARGEVAVRGAIVDVYPSTADHPVRVELWGDEVERLGAFSVADQRTTEPLEEAVLFPARELLPTGDVRERARRLLEDEPWGAEHWDRLAQGAVFDGMESWLPWLCPDEHLLTDLFPPASLVVLVEPRRLRDRASELLDEEAALARTLATTWGAGDREFPRLSLPFDRLLAHTRAPMLPLPSAPEGPDTPAVAATAFDPVVGDTEALTTRLRRLVADGFRVIVAADGEGSARRIADLLAGEDIATSVHAAVAPDDAWLAAPGVHVVVEHLERGFVVSGARLAVIAEADLTGRRRVHRRSRARTARRDQDFYEGLEPGDHVVHRVHGVGRYVGMESREMFGVVRDRLKIEFKGGDAVYLDSDDIGLVRRYTGGESPTLSRMGGADWDKTRGRVRGAVRDIAAELVSLYRARQSTPGLVSAPEPDLEAQLAASFPYELTPDQARAVTETLDDMAQPQPMDRLVCGDVGYGKTEVAIRAAGRAVFAGRQVAVLVPTTLLAGQHVQTFRERFADFPVRVEVLSRLVGPKEQAVSIAGVADGSVDIVVGTHRLLSEDVRFARLGLLVVDEEQRFGVAAKERIKTMRTDVDVLTLTATPIPRTLELSLTGIRDVSMVNTPPEDRQPILTYVGEHDERAVAEAIRRELLREGQVLFVHNRIRDLDHVAGDVRELVPEARVAIAHGRLDEGRLERVVTEFWEREHDVLVCTTIVESGLDMPTVNTLVVDRADLLGLAQLYQLRGRVGRRGQRAYAYLFHPRDQVLSEEAYERLKTIGEFTDLGSGFKIAMRDLEIRGAGNLLGGEQSGHIAAVGFDLYVEMVSEAVDELTGRTSEPEPEISVDVPVTAHLPRDYVARDDVRMEAYRRLAAVTSPADVDDVRAEWEDRYGTPPPEADALLAVARLRVECRRRGIVGVSVPRDVARFDGWHLLRSQQARLRRFSARAKAHGGVVTVPLAAGGSRPGGRDLVDRLVRLLDEIAPVDLDPPAAVECTDGEPTGE